MKNLSNFVFFFFIISTISLYPQATLLNNHLPNKTKIIGSQANQLLIKNLPLPLSKEIYNEFNKNKVTGNGYLLSNLLTQSWENNNWVNDTRISYSYNAENNLKEALFQNMVDTGWVTVSKYLYTYDSNNNLIEALLQIWKDSSWVKRYKTTDNYYNNNRTLILAQVNKDTNLVDTSWVNFNRGLFFYNGNNNLIEILFQTWGDSIWINSEKDTLLYDANNNESEIIGQDWKDTVWINSIKDIYTYDGNNNLIQDLSQVWFSPNWRNAEKETYTYDGNGNKTADLIQMWNDTTWVNYQRDFYTYSSILGITNKDNVTPNEFKLLQNYPNPFNPTTTIKYEIPKNGMVTLKVFNVLGQEVKTLINQYQNKGMHKINFNSSNLTSGIYFYQMRAGAFVSTKKMILLK